jgi:carboxynorspermidine decarboxylase
LGLRINTELSFAKDSRYDPSRIPSKLGIPLSSLKDLLENDAMSIQNVGGLLIHSNCESEDFGQLLMTVQHVESQIPGLLEQINWINLGGGYLFDESTDWSPFEEAVALLTKKYDLEVFFEPGRGVVGEAGYIVSSVVDVFESGKKSVAVLDTTVNHMPEVFEYQYRPPVIQESPSGPYKYILAGATCLAGDLFGEYSFDSPLEIGSRVVFEDQGAYTLVKANMFNGINLPAIYVLKSDGELELVREFDYQDFLSRCGARRDATIRERVLGSQTE